MVLPDMKPGTYLTDRLTDECLALIEANRRRPFFVYMAYHTVHTPIQGRRDLIEHYRNKLRPGQQVNPTYAAMVHCLDENVGRILAKLDELKTGAKNPGAALDRTTLYWHYPHNSPQGGTPSGAIRQGDLKLIEFFDDGRLELYNLADDLGEQHDLSEKMSEKTRELHDELTAWRSAKWT